MTTVDRTFVLTRQLNAPQGAVWRAWTHPYDMEKWWAPNDFWITIEKLDLRAGGECRFRLHRPDGIDTLNLLIYKEIEKPKRILYVQPGQERDDPVHFEVLLELEERNGGTYMTMRHIFANATEMERIVRDYDLAEKTKQAIDKLESHLQKMLKATLTEKGELITERTFEAPPEVVFRAFSQPEFLPRWRGSRMQSMTLCDVDLRPGGEFRIVLRNPDGTESGSSGRFTDIRAPEFIEQAFEFDSSPGVKVTESASFHSRDGKTVLREVIACQSPEICARMYESCIENGMSESYERLGEVVEDLMNRRP